ncbi:hypothetical protein Goari_005128 [Gossypium aridum]|uniref:Uncharacterized protein n=1 Tax=Gossypium aridum TaxID=34290 RepID=A0A7J8Y605_GOSAI|nr:hypothetical protein [Gossypium aridum]
MLSSDPNGAEPEAMVGRIGGDALSMVRKL